MATKLVIVESPTKAHKIGDYLGKGYTVMASVGHIRDLAQPSQVPAADKAKFGKFGVDVNDGFKPYYIVDGDKKRTVSELKSALKNADELYLATDEDRAGEAIAWHLVQTLKPEVPVKRMVFHEITKNAINASLNNTRDVDGNMVDAQETRRILDRLYGYELSPVLWRKVGPGLSAGRVQSVATRLIVERERERMAFKRAPYWDIVATLSAPDALGERAEFSARMIALGGKRLAGSKDFGADGQLTPDGFAANVRQLDEAGATAVASALKTADFTVMSMETKPYRRRPQPPFTTSTLQQTAGNRLGMGARAVMRAAQSLYENGYITYMRTDSLRISDEALSAAHDYIQRTYGENYALAKPRTFRSKSNAQDGHEAIRPTMIDLAPAKIKESLSSDQYKLYKLVWERFIASQMAACVQDTVSTDITAGEHLFKASGFSVRFDGYTRLYTEAVDNEEEQETNLPRLEEGEHLTLKELKPNQHFTQPPPRYTEATLIRELEENGIGSPSTYAPTLSTILQRGYVERDGKALKPTIVGETVNSLMKEQFGKIVDVKFTAEMERELDEVEEGKTEWVGMMHHFYDDFTDMLQSAEKNMEGTKMKIPDEETDIVCELCGRKMVVRHGKYGKFLACPGFPECKNTKTLQQETPGACPRCGKKVLAKKSKTGRTYYGCEDNPKCGFMTWDIPLAEKCPQCGSSLFKTTGRVKMIHCLKEGCGYEKSAK